ncbi:hypothetical protein [Clostridium sp. DL1XJH146]
MKLKELKKIYKYDIEREQFIIDVQLEDYRDAYSDWDFSPFINRDLDDDLTEYLLECSFEIPIKSPMIINFHILNQKQNPAREERSIKGMYNYFGYEIRKLKNYRMRVLRHTLTFFIVGTVLLVLGSLLDEIMANSIFTKVLSEGFSIGGWVMIWEMFSTWFFDIKKVTHKVKHFIKLKSSNIIYTYS